MRSSDFLPLDARSSSCLKPGHRHENDRAGQFQHSNLSGIDHHGPDGAPGASIGAGTGSFFFLWKNALILFQMEGFSVVVWAHVMSFGVIAGIFAIWGVAVTVVSSTGIPL
jgi:hypothetical protein